VTWSAATRQEEPLTAPGSSAADRLQLVYDWSSDDTSLLVTKAMPNGNTPEVRYEAPGDSINVAVWQVPVSAAPHAESKERLLISGPAYKIYQPHQSPDGRWIVFEAAQKRPQDLTRTQPSSLYVMRASGGPWLPIIVGENWADKPRWSPDGQTIYFLWDQGSFFNVWGIRFDPETGKTRGHPFQVTTLDNPALMISRHMGSVEMSVTRQQPRAHARPTLRRHLDPGQRRPLIPETDARNRSRQAVPLLRASSPSQPDFRLRRAAKSHRAGSAPAESTTCLSAIFC
jgi:dipeptidyl aminopeptidase/acylaminoacyl peptidase